MPMTVGERHMREALRLAALGRGHTSPNPMVGAVVVGLKDTVVGTGFHERAGGRHAEVRALDAAGDAARGSTLYCTLEPCCHQGRTGPCVDRIVAAGVGRVVVAMLDPNPEVNGRGVARLRQHGLEVEVGPSGAEAARLNAAFVRWVTTRRPLVTMKVALSRDGCIAGRVGTRTALTSAEANARVDQRRADVDAVAVGSNTVLVDDPRLTTRTATRSRPLTRVVLDRRLRVSPQARLFGTLSTGPVVVVTTGHAADEQPARLQALRDTGAEVEVMTGDGAMRETLAHLGRRDITDLIVEGGREVHAALWRERLVDRVELFVAPSTVGAGGVRWIEREPIMRELSSVVVTRYGPDLVVEGDVHRAH